MGKLKVLLLFMLVVSSLSFVLSEDTNTTVTIVDSPPYIIKDIPDIFLVINENAINYLDLDDYFGEDNGDTLTITWEPMAHVTVTVDSQHRVSFYPQTGFIGAETTRFNVSDNAGTAVGNYFDVTVGQDTSPPKWYNPARTSSVVYQNTVLNFTTIWKDNVRLGNYIFSINQGTGWVNTSTRLFSGTQNVSNTQLKISASPLTTVYWRYYAEDFYGNLNVTDVQSFTVKEASSTDNNPTETPYNDTSSTSGQSSAPQQSLLESIVGTEQRSDFRTDINNLKVSLRQGDTATKVIKITNIGTTKLEFTTAIGGLDRYTVLETGAFSLEPKEAKRLAIDFNIPSSAVPDQYFGYLKIIAGGHQVEIPIALEIRKFESEINLEVTIPKEYKRVRQGQTAYADVKITNLKDVKQMNLSLYYAIKDFSGNIISTNTTDISIFSSLNKRLSLGIPKETPSDEYLFYVRATGKDVIDIGSDSFFIGARFQIMRILQQFSYFIIFLILLTILIILYINHKRNKKKQRALELYVMLNQLRDFVKEGKTADAVEVYKRIKITYGQHISKSFQKDKNLLKAELDKFANMLKQNPIKENVVQNGAKPEAKSNKKGLGLIFSKLKDKIFKKKPEHPQAIQPQTAGQPKQVAPAEQPAEKPQSKPAAKQASPQPATKPQSKPALTAQPVQAQAKPTNQKPAAKPQPAVSVKSQLQPAIKQPVSQSQPQTAKPTQPTKPQPTNQPKQNDQETQNEK